MAEILTATEQSPLISGFDTSRIRNIEDSSIPWGMMSHVKQFTAPQVGSGDTGKVQVYLRIPENYLCQLTGFHLDMYSTSAPTWNEGIFVNFYSGLNTFSPGYASQEIAFPLAVTSVASIGSNQYKNVGIANAGENSAYDVNSPVNYLFKQGYGSADFCPRIDLYSNPNTHATTFRMAITWKLYDINQNNHPYLAAK